MADKNDPSEMGKKGGEARARKLTPKQRSEIARKAADARWDRQSPRVTYSGVLKLGGAEMDCAVLEDGTRVISERAFARALGAKRGGSHWIRQREGGAKLPVFLSANRLQPFIDEELLAELEKPIVYSGEGGRSHGYKAELVPKMLDVLLRARDAGALLKSQEPLAKQADILMRGLAHVGIIALVDEATGFQRYRDRDNLAKILEAFVAKEIQKWIKTFDLEFYELICHVRGEPLSRAYKRPAYFGHLTNDIVYRRLAPGVLRALRAKNPVTEDGRRKHRHFQHLTPDLGHPKLKDHLISVVSILKVVKAQGGNWDDFMALLDKVHAPYVDMPLFDSPEEERDADE